MSRLSEILGVKEGQEFKVTERGHFDTYKIDGERRMYKSSDGNWYECTNEKSLIDMILHKHLIHPIPEKPQLTEQQITAIKGRIAEGTPWAARDKDSDNTIYFFPNKPRTNSAKISWHAIEMKDLVFVTVGSNKNNLYDFITYDNSPVYLPELVEGEEK